MIVFPGGKSELYRAGCRVTPGGVMLKRGFSDSATENIPPGILIVFLNLVRVKWRVKSSPAAWQQAGLENRIQSKAK